MTGQAADMSGTTSQRIETVIIGGGQAGLATGYQLARRGLPFVILDANDRIGDGWRNRWDSLRLFTPARYDGLPGWPFPAPDCSSPTRTRWPATWRPMRPGSLSRFEPASAWTGSPGRRTGTSWRLGTAGTRPTMWSWHRARTGARGFPLLRPSSIRASCSCIPANTGTHPSFGPAASSSSALPTRGLRSRWRYRDVTRPGCRGGTRAKNPSDLEAGGIGSSCRWSGSWPRTSDRQDAGRAEGSPDVPF